MSEESNGCPKGRRVDDGWVQLVELGRQRLGTWEGWDRKSEDYLHGIRSSTRGCGRAGVRHWVGGPRVKS